MNHEITILITIVASVVFGMLANVLAHRWHFPAIVLLLAFGILLGENGLNIVQTAEMEHGLGILVKLAVAIILFEGALNLNLRSLRESAKEVRNLVTFGVLVSWGITTLIAHFVAGFTWQLALLFGALMTVTGPTVIQPLLRRVSVQRQVKTILEGEAILIDPIGAILAIAVLDIILAVNTQGTTGFFQLIWAYFGRLLIGGLVGAAGAFLLSCLVKTRRLIPLDLSNLVALACVWGTFGVAEWLQSEAGIMSAVVMGLVVQREAIPGERQLRRFKETLTTLGISMLFILLAANLEISSLWAQGIGGILTVILIMFVARPAAVFISTWRTGLDWRKKAFIAWLGPRGIIAASVASIFAVTLKETGNSGGEQLLALTFLTIITTVIVQGLSTGGVARMLGLQTLGGQKALIVGANKLGFAVAEVLQEHGRPTQLIDTNLASIGEANKRNLPAIHGNALEETTLETIHAEEAATFLAVTSNSEVNVLACQIARDDFGIERAFPLLTNPAKGANSDLSKQTGGRLAFGQYVQLSDWDAAGETQNKVSWTVPKTWPQIPLAEIQLPLDLLPIVRVRNNDPVIVHADQIWQPGDVVIVLSPRPPEEIIPQMEQAGKGEPSPK